MSIAYKFGTFYIIPFLFSSRGTKQDIKLKTEKKDEFEVPVLFLFGFFAYFFKHFFLLYLLLPDSCQKIC